MVREFELPDVGEGVAEGELVSWMVEEGDEVSEDQPVAEVETDKALVEVPSPVDGTVRELHVEAGEVVPVGTVIISFNVEGEAEAAAEEDQERASEPAGVDEPDDAETRADAAEPAGSAGAIGAEADETATPQDRVFAPPRVRRMARDEGIDLSGIQGTGPGGRITTSDVQAAAGGGSAGNAQAQGTTGAETEAEAAPTDTGSSDTGTDAGGDAGDVATESVSSSPGETTTEPPAQVESADRDKTLAAPATRRIAKEEDVDIDAVPEVEERDGEAFVTPEAVREYAEAQQRAQERDREALEAGESVGQKGTDFAPGERERREQIGRAHV